MNRRLLRHAIVALVLFAVWTVAVRVSISEGSRTTTFMLRALGDWPPTVDDLEGSSNLELSIFASYAENDIAAGATAAGVPGLFGRPSIGSEVDTADSGYTNGSRFTTGIRAGTVSSISAYVAGPVDAPPHDQFQLAIYTDSHGAPGRRLANTASGTLEGDAWNTLPISAVVEPSTAYWLMYNTNGSSADVNNLTYAPVGGATLDNAIRAYRSAALTNRADLATSIGNMLPTTAALLVLCLFVARRRLRAALALLIGFGAALFVAWLLRVALFDPFGLYPSGHALRTTYVAVAFCFVVPRRGAIVAGALLVLVVCVSAVYGGRHFSEEVIGGALLGLAFATGAKAFASTARTRASVEPLDDDDPGSEIDVARGSIA